VRHRTEQIVLAPFPVGELRNLVPRLSPSITIARLAGSQSLHGAANALACRFVLRSGAT
jgi:hypothetical protein